MRAVTIGIFGKCSSVLEYDCQSVNPMYFGSCNSYCLVCFWGYSFEVFNLSGSHGDPMNH